MHVTRRLALVVAAIACLSMLPAGVAGADLATLSDAITAGVVRSDEGFGTSTVIVPTGGYVTYLVQGSPGSAGLTVEIWTRTRTTDWAAVTTRTLGVDGTARYFARVAEWTAFWAKLPGGSGALPVAVSHGRNATVSADGSTRLRVWCDDFTSETPGSVLVSRTVGVRVGSLVSVTVCSNASTGFSWAPAAVSSQQLTLVTHHDIPGPSTIGAAGAEMWTFRVTGRGTGYAVLAYSRPWDGGEKAAWLVQLRVN